MGIWIRSQDKENLINVIAVGVDIGNNVFAFINNDKVESIVIGNYSTKEKTLKVLDMIEETIKGRKTTDYGISENGDFVSNNYFEKLENIVFQMPQDDEVLENDK